MKLIKTTIMTSFSTVIKIITSLGITKIIAIHSGANGFAVIGQLQNFKTIIMTFANGAITQGVIKYTAEYHDDVDNKSYIFSTAIIIALTCSSLTGIFLYKFAPNLSNIILKTGDYANVFVIFGFTIIFFALNTFFLAILNGQKEIMKLVVINCSSSVFSLVISWILIKNLGLVGALYALVTNQSVIFIITLAYIVKSPWFKIMYFIKGLDIINLIKLGKYSLMTLTTAFTIPVSHIIIRNHIGETLGWDNAGYWQGIWYVSNMYLMIITSSLGIYYLPRLSEINNNELLKKELFYGYKIILPIVSIIALVIYLLKGFIVNLVFTDDFSPMLNLFKWQLIGDVIRIASWLFGYVVVAKAMTKIYIYNEIAFSCLFIILSILFLKYYGLIGITYAFSLCYLIQLIVMSSIFHKYITKQIV